MWPSKPMSKKHHCTKRYIIHNQGRPTPRTAQGLIHDGFLHPNQCQCAHEFSQVYRTALLSLLAGQALPLCSIPNSTAETGCTTFSHNLHP